jgi:hypothetical protein
VKAEQIAPFADKAAPLYVAPDAARALLLAGLKAPSGSPLQERARRALECLNPDAGEVEQPTNFYLPTAASILFEAASAPAPSEQRTRAGMALAWLDPQRDLGELALDVATPGDDPLMPFALAVATVQLEVLRGADARDRRRLAGLLHAVCKEAAGIARRRGAKVAA